MREGRHSARHKGVARKYHVGQRHQAEAVGGGWQLLGEAWSSVFQLCSCYFHCPWSSFYLVPT
ncbi:unnamed protein product [Gulo gulo]|uniref:Uncharacterized protein n=1 Tax=Gulo gulo TaxID=48420 RepID=A0A9X9PVY0_GULGU|nr:unnamed protein product [Gulo gulo]